MEKANLEKWDALSTVKSFDFGGCRSCTRDSGLANNMQLDVIQSNATTPISLLIQSLVKQLCTLLEKDVNRANYLYNSICEKLHSMNLIDDSYAMGEFEVMRSQYQRALYQLVTVTGAPELPITIPASWPIVQPSGLEWSRYHKEFEELYFIAGGGFGSVFKARHRLDGVEYAVKKVYIKSSDVNSIMSHLAEVKTIASLNHPNIVNYKAAWLEPMIETSARKKDTFPMDMDSTEFTPLNSKLNPSTYPNILTSFKTHNSKDLRTDKSQSDFEISFKNSSSYENLYDSSESDTSESDEEPTPQDENAVANLFSSKEYENCSRVNLKWATLYIQMTFCQQTLKQWLDERNNNMSLKRKSSVDLPDLTLHHCDSNDSTCLETVGHENYPITWTHIDVLIDMFTQLVRGLHYIHSRGIIHHDIKPSNVFVGQSESGVLVQLGDFGLACPLQQSHSGLALGTHMYAAPEQLDGQCNPKSDMYSLGIILLEMVEPFSTDMERVKTITDLRKGQIPAHLTANYPKIAHIIGKLVQRRPSRRLDTNQLLEELKQLSENKDDTIKSLREELAAKDDEIARLKMMLAKALDKDCTLDDDDEDIQKLIQTSKVNPTVSPFVSSTLKATLQNGITTKIINGGAAGDGEPKDIIIEPKLTVTEPKGDPSERKWFTAEPTLITAEPTVFINEPKLNTTEPKLFAIDPEQAMKGPKLVSKTKKPPRNVAMASFLESIGVDQSPKLLTEEKEPKQLKTVLLKPDHFTVTAETVEKPEHTKLVDETSSGNFDNSNTFVNEKLDNLLDNSKQVATPKKGLLRLKPGSMFKGKTTPPESHVTTPEPPKHKQTSTVNTLKMYTPSKWAAQYYKTYTERANMQVILNEDVHTSSLLVLRGK